MTSHREVAAMRLEQDGPPQRSAWPRALFFAIAAALVAALFPASSPRLHANVDVQRADRAPASDLPRAAIDKRPVHPHPAVRARDIEALVDIVAGKYRVSRSSLRKLVRAAYREGLRIGVDPLLVIAVMGVESSFNPGAISHAGAVGPMQVIPRFHADKFDAAGGQTVHDPETNIQVGVKVLKEYIARDGDQVAGLQRYNGASGDPSNAYAKKVLREKQWLKQSIRRSSAGTSA